ncbi:MAG: transposase [Bacteroidetes bacterium]|uniref:REP-associated tyrosine transposase n=1 Tax=Phnomibacter sp. TaxID=2836217 RepID=UPI002FDE910E|nr:transposase [Bacteroidota bacterium]
MHLFYSRQGQMDDFNLYFYTQTIQGFQPLLAQPMMRTIVLDSLRHLCKERWVTIYGFVLMPNHIHLLWRMEGNERKESAAASFSKFTSHHFKKALAEQAPALLAAFSSTKNDRQYQFWKRDPLAIPITSEEALLQKLRYIHDNPVRAGLCATPEAYAWSSATYYATGEDRFGILTNVYG